MPKAKKLPSGKWRVQAAITVDGKLIRKSFTADSPKKAEQMALNWQNDVIMEAIEDVTLEQGYQRYIDAKRNVLSPSTIKGYLNLSQNALQEIMPYKVSKLTIEQIQMAINIFAANHSPKSVRNCCGLLSAVLKMFRPGFNFRVSLPQKEKKNIYIPSDDDIKRLIAVAKGTSYYIPILLAAFGGMRQGEICALTDKDIGTNYVTISKSMVLDETGEWQIKPPKTFSSNRKVELPLFVINEIQGKKDRIVTQNPHALSVGFNRLLKTHGFPHFRFHDLRHYYVSSLHAIGIPDKYIMAQGGWATNYTMQTVYNHVLSQQQSQFSEQVANHFNSFVSN